MLIWNTTRTSSIYYWSRCYLTELMWFTGRALWAGGRTESCSFVDSTALIIFVILCIYIFSKFSQTTKTKLQKTSFANISNCVAKSFVYLYRRIKKYLHKTAKKSCLKKIKKIACFILFSWFFSSIVFKNSNILYIFSVLIMLVCLIFIFFFIFSHSFETFYFLFSYFSKRFFDRSRERLFGFLDSPLEYSFALYVFLFLGSCISRCC